VDTWQNPIQMFNSEIQFRCSVQMFSAVQQSRMNSDVPSSSAE